MLTRLLFRVRSGAARHRGVAASARAAALAPASEPQLRVHVEWCNACGGVYGGVLQRLYVVAEKRAPVVDVTSSVGRLRAFEVSVDGGGAAYSAHSKLASNAFPAVDALVDELAAFAAAGGSAAPPPHWRALTPEDAARVRRLIQENA
jgi:hypothetical protein